MNHLSVNYGEVLDVTMSLYRVDLEEMTGRGRMPIVVKARRMFACTMRHLGHSYPEIARMLLRNNHSSVHSMVSYMRGREEFDRVVYLALRLVYEKRLGVTTSRGIEEEMV